MMIAEHEPEVNPKWQDLEKKIKGDRADEELQRKARIKAAKEKKIRMAVREKEKIQRAIEWEEKKKTMNIEELAFEAMVMGIFN